VVHTACIMARDSLLKYAITGAALWCPLPQMSALHTLWVFLSGPPEGSTGYGES